MRLCLRDERRGGGTSGAPTVTNRRQRLLVCAGLVAVAAAVLAAKAGLSARAAERGEMGIDAWRAWPAEVTSLVGLIAALPVALAADRLSHSRAPDGLRSAALAFGALLFSFVHVAAMSVARAAIGPPLPDAFAFVPERDWLGTLLGDTLAYSSALAALAAWRAFSAPVAEKVEPPVPKAEAQLPPLVRLSDGGRETEIDPSDLCAVSGGGNYVELVFRNGRRTMLRTTLAAAEAALAALGFRRTHKSWLVRLDSVRALQRTPAGDYRLELGAGLEAPLSRRNRDLVAEIARKVEGARGANV